MNWKIYSKEKPDMSKLKSNEKACIFCLVELEWEDGRITYEIATFHPNIITIGGHFDFDMPPIKKWVYLNDILTLFRRSATEEVYGVKMEFDEEKAKAYLEELKKDKLFNAKLEFGRLLMKPEHEFTEEEKIRFKELNELIMKEVS